MSDQTNRKRRRLGNTIPEQYELYLSYMDNDEIFRSNTINPTVDPDYLLNKWKELTIKLNAIGKGPALTVEEWKKRFKDWKYATKAKYRKIVEHSKKTGSGPKLNLEITAMEDRALTAWGKVTVMGANVTRYEGIELEQADQEAEVQPNLQNLLSEDVFEDCNESLNEENLMVLEVTPSTSYEKSTVNPRKEISQKNKRSERRRIKPLSQLAENLLKSTENTNCELLDTVKSICNKYVELEKEKLDLEKQKFKFELSKFKFLNEDFNF